MFGRVELRNLHRQRLPESLRTPICREVQPDWRGLLERLVLQIRAGEARDEAGHRRYIEAASALGLKE